MCVKGSVSVVGRRSVLGGVHPSRTCAIVGEQLWANLENLGVLASHFHLESSTCLACLAPVYEPLVTGKFMLDQRFFQSLLNSTQSRFYRAFK